LKKNEQENPLLGSPGDASPATGGLKEEKFKGGGGETIHHWNIQRGLRGFWGKKKKKKKRGGEMLF